MIRVVRRRTALAIGLATGALAAPMLARYSEAQSLYRMGKTVRMVVPFAAGGTADLLARVVAEILAESTTATFLIDNRPGAGGNVGAEIVARAPPDGMTLLLGTLGTAVTNQYVYRELPYDSEESFAPVALVGEVTNVVVAHPSFPATTLKEFVDYCKVQGPNNVTYSSPGVGSAGHLSMEYLQLLADMKLAHVAYRGRSAMMKALVAGHVPIAMDNLPPYQQHLQSGALRALGVSSSKRWFAAPDLPTVAEQGYPDFDTAHWWYVAAPAGTRLDVVNKLSDAIVKGIKCEPAIKRIRDAGAWERPGNAEDLARHMAAENRKWKYVIGAANIQKQ
ncbi:tripartite tricarboxylate transporter substrate binding protein [Reyranella sp.]|uniref:Bug family tripartite tricarboxylate transporter substrate binding protein n=1 Tax=Reyranella sp. TaxID=1929291 RepID=UPI00122B3232|nr:tripartite tricarboxylate transporter substrate-binding protein [Reyranella sp.]TAJ84770.1 MAG: tripartite tricarboxylate transporter substrate binding protein [Reyranella sp.]